MSQQYTLMERMIANGVNIYNTQEVFEFFHSLGSGEGDGLTTNDVLQLFQIWAADYALKNDLDRKLNRDEYQQHFRGLFLNFEALVRGVSNPVSGDYAIYDAGVGQKAVLCIYDANDRVWRESGSNAVALTSTDELAEGGNNLYFTSARVLAIVQPIFDALNDRMDLDQIVLNSISQRITQILDALSALDGIASGISDASTSLNLISQGLSAVSDNVIELKNNQISINEDRINDFLRIDTALSNLSTSISGLSVKSDQIKTVVDASKIAIDQGFSGLNLSHAAVGEKIDLLQIEINQNQIAINSEFLGLAQSLSDHSSAVIGRFNTISVSLTTLIDGQTSAAGKLNDIKADTGSAVTQIGEVKTATTNAAVKLGEIQTATNSNGDKLDLANASLADLSNALGDIDASLSEILGA